MMAVLPHDDRGCTPDALDQRLTVAFGLSRSRRPGVLETLTGSFGPVPRVMLRDTDVEPPVVRPTSDEVPVWPDAAGRYQLFGEIARGGMGAVLKGRDPDLGRELAVKVLLEKHQDDPEMVRRFVEEAQIAGQLQHPGIVPVYELGAFSDRPYFSMRLVKGRTLASILSDRPYPYRWRDLSSLLGIFEAIAQTMAYAHARGVIHRDLKPSNVIVGAFGEVQVMDWGLAKVLTQGGVTDDASAGRTEEEPMVATARSASDSDLSVAGSVMGTPSYMAPEQARGEVDALDERADVFALGSILTEIMTGKPAFTGRNPGDIQRKAFRGDLAPAFARLDASGSDLELVALAKLCLSPERDDRPRDAGEIARAIGSYRTGVEDRLHAAEISRAAETARAEEAQRTAEAAQARANAERRARRATAALAASVLVLVLAGGAAAFRVAQERQIVATRLAQVLAEAETLRTRALARPDDPVLWQTLVEAVKRAEDVLGDGGGSPEVGKRLLALRSEADTGYRMASQDRTLLQKLVEIRANRQDAGAAATHAAYDAAFRVAGFDFNTLIPAEAARDLERRPVSVRAEFATYLDDWYRGDFLPDGLHKNPMLEHDAQINNPSVERTGAAKLRELACLIDPDEFRDQLRSLRKLGPIKDSLGKLRELAADPRAESLPASTAVLLASFFEAAGAAADAADILRKAVMRHPDDLWTNYRLAANLQYSTPYPQYEAVRYYTAARAIRPTSAHMLAHLLSDLPGRLPEAKALYLDLAARQPEVSSHLLCLARALKARNQHREAESIADRLFPALQSAARSGPSKQVFLDLARVQAIKGDVPGALESIRVVAKLIPRDRHWMHIEAGNVLRDTAHDPEGAIVEYREAIRLKPDFDGSHFELGRTLNELESYEEAVSQLREADRLRPGVWGVQMLLGTALMGLGKIDEAMAAYHEAIRMEPTRPYIHFQLGRDLAKRGKVDEAIAELREGTRIFPNDTNCHNELAKIFEGVKGDYAAAAAEFREVARINPDEPDAYSNFGLMLFKSGKMEEGLAICREAARLRPEWGNGRYKYGSLLFNNVHDYEAAFVEFQAAARFRPDIESWLGLAKAAIKLRKDREAIDALRKVLKLVPESSKQANDLKGWIADLEQGRNPDTHLPW
jgi:tetratricopeptide (TPR) repeat protein